MVTRTFLRSTGREATALCVGLALPALTRIARRLQARFGGDPATIQAAVLSGFVTEFAVIDFGKPFVFWRLARAGYWSGLAVTGNEKDHSRREIGGLINASDTRDGITSLYDTPTATSPESTANGSEAGADDRADDTGTAAADPASDNSVSTDRAPKPRRSRPDRRDLPRHRIRLRPRYHIGPMMLLAGLFAAASLVMTGASAHAATTADLAIVGSFDGALSNLRDWLMGIIAGLATVYLTISGVRYVMSGDDPSEIEKAKAGFKAAGVGYILAALSPLVLEVLKQIVKA
jgi:hypothetical protein